MVTCWDCVEGGGGYWSVCVWCVCTLRRGQKAVVVAMMMGACEGT